MSRSTAEWIGKNDDQRVPDYVRLRVFLNHDGICHISNRKIRPGEPWELEHIKALCNGGEHRETNLAPALGKPHKLKTKQDRADKATTDRKRKMNVGIRPISKFACSRNSKFKKKISGEVVMR